MTRGELELALGKRARRDPRLRAVAAAATEAGARALVVGGWVRDLVLGREPRDLDLVATGKVAPLVSALETVWGKRSYRFRKRGVTTHRFDVEGRPIDLVDAGRRGLEADLLRREWTINAVAFDLASGRVVDPAGGLRDLRARRLRLPRAGAVREDPVRALRAARFLAQIPGLRLDRNAREEVVRARRALRRASAERVRDELDRLLVSNAPHLGLDALATWGLIDAVLPELAPLRDCVAGADRPDVWTHTVDAVRTSVSLRPAEGGGALRDPAARLVLRWALLLHDVSKPETLRRADGGKPTFHGHEVLGARRADALLRRLRQPRDLRRRVRALVLLHLRPGHLADSGASPRGLRRLVQDAGADLPLLVAHAASDVRASGGPPQRGRLRRLRSVLASLLARFEEEREHPLPALVTGRDVMRILEIGPGPEVGKVLREARALQADGALADRAAALRHLEDVARRRG